MATALGDIHSDFIAPGAPNRLDLSSPLLRDASIRLKDATTLTLPNLEAIFATPQHHVERLLANDIYPPFVKHQMTTSASIAFMTNREKSSGLGDCFCITNPQ